MKIEDGWNLGNDLETRRGGQNGKKWRGKDIAHGYWITGVFLERENGQEKFPVSVTHSPL